MIMDGSQQTIARDANGRFVPGCSGNPAGKLPGTRNRATVLAEALQAGEAENIARVVIDKAVSGDAVAARFCLDRLSPKPRGRAIRLDLPEGESAGGDVVAMFNSALRALASGDITPDEAVAVARFLEGRLRVLKAWAQERDLTWYPELPIPGDRFQPGKDADETAPAGARLAPARSSDRSEGRRGQASPLRDPSDDERKQALREALERTPPQDDEIIDLLFDETGKLAVPRDLLLPQLDLLSACLSREMERRNLARAGRDAEGGGMSRATGRASVSSGAVSAAQQGATQ
jgi:hypothetical protein